MKIFHLTQKNLFYLIIIITLRLFISCTPKIKTTEKVISRHLNGQPKIIHIFEVQNDHQIKVGEMWYFDSGQIQRQRMLKDGYPNGVWEEWFSNGQKRMEKNYTNGDLDSLQQGWYPTGEKMFEAEYDNGILRQRTVWNIDGSVKSTE